MYLAWPTSLRNKFIPVSCQVILTKVIGLLKKLLLSFYTLHKRTFGPELTIFILIQIIGLLTLLQPERQVKPISCIHNSDRNLAISQVNREGKCL